MTRTGRVRLPDHLFALRDQYVTVAGEIAAVAIEQDPDPLKVDHVWLTVRAGSFGRLQISLSTMSRQSRHAGFDPRIRLAIVGSTWTELPKAGVEPATPLDYATLEAAQPVEFNSYERTDVERLLVERARRAIFAEGRGEFYVRAHIGIHQVHCRRASYAVPRDLIGRDGALRFFFVEENLSELLLFKFAGQP